ncbi:hypothetical protein HJ142_25130, partial [Vibrio parahaemolyticus]|nr:hypothetical protein [Vibrio parahaemolyticus]
MKYGIQPVSQVNVANNKLVVGSGPFSVVEHSENRLKPSALKALTTQLTQANVTSWLPSTAVVVRMA